MKNRVVALDINETRTRNFVRELERRGFQTIAFESGTWMQVAQNLYRFARASMSSDFVLCGANPPKQLPFLFLASLLGRRRLVDCPMDITAWPFPERLHWRLYVAAMLHSASHVITIRSRAYLSKKFHVPVRKMLYLESCPDVRKIHSEENGQARYQRAPNEFLICCSGCHEHHRLNRFLPIFEALVRLLDTATLLIIGEETKSIVPAAKALANRPEFHGKIRIMDVIRPVEDFYATIRQCDLWIATLGDDTLQGQHEFRMELLEVGLFGKAVASVLTPGLREQGFRDGRDILAIDPSDAAGSASKIAALAKSPAALQNIAENLRRRVERDFSLTAAIDGLLDQVLSKDQSQG